MSRRGHTGAIETVAALVATCVLLAACGDDPMEPAGEDPSEDPSGTRPVFAQVASGFGHTCALDDEGGVWCWGANLEGQLGLGNTEGVDTSTPAAVESAAIFVSVGVGDFHTCALDDSGTAHCWGVNDQGQVGDGTNEARDVPVPVADGHVFTDLAVGGAHSCGIVSLDEAYCWGDDSAGQLGDADSGSRNVPVPIALELNGGDQVRPVTITAGASHTCVLDPNRTSYCWGNNGTGQLGDGTTISSEIPVEGLDGGILDFVTLTAGTSHTCATAAGGGYCWGFNLFGQLGDGSNDDVDRPSQVEIADVELPLLSAGADHTCGVSDESLAYCWGFNGAGRLGDGTETDRNVPTAVDGALIFSDISAGVLHTCGVTTECDVYCWGQNDAGQLGVGGNGGSVVPVEVVISGE
jgi:alpha-tubulin suppressor-like RCC1 family protein